MKKNVWAAAMTIALLAACLLVLAACSSGGASASAAAEASSSSSEEEIVLVDLKSQPLYVEVKDTYVYDEHGNLLTFISGSRNVDESTYFYDDPTIGYPNSLHTDMPVEGLGLMTMDAIFTWEYDDQGRAVSMTSVNPANGRTYTENAWTYHPSGSIASVSHGGIVTTYDEDGYRTGVSNGTRSITYEWERDKYGMVTGYTKTEGSTSEVFTVDVNESGFITAVYSVGDGSSDPTLVEAREYQKVDDPSLWFALEGFLKDVPA